MHSNGSPLLVKSSPRRPEEWIPPRSTAGFLLLDPSMRPIVFNAEATRVLSYPNDLANVRHPDVFLAGKIRESLLSRRPSRESSVVTEFRSGRRRYLSRAFSWIRTATGFLTPASPSWSKGRASD